VVFALFVMLMFSSGLGFYNHSVFIQALHQEAGFKVETVSLAVSVFFLVGGLSGLINGRLIELYDTRYIVVTGTLLRSFSLWALGHVSTTFELMAVYSLFGVGFSSAGLLPATTLVEHYTLSQAGPWLGILYLVCVLPLVLYLLRSYPSDMGLEPDGRVTTGDSSISGIQFRQALRQHFFWGLSIAYVLTMTAQVGGIAHQYGILSERLTTAQAAWAIAIMPMFSVIGRLVGGVILDAVSTLKFTVVMMTLHGASLVFVSYATNPWGIYLGMALFGISVGNLLMLQPLIIAEIYGLMHYARLYSWSNLITMIGVSGGPMLLGLIYGATGEYQPAYLTVGLLGLASAMLFAILKAPTK